MGLAESLTLGSWVSAGPVPVQVAMSKRLSAKMGMPLLRWFQGGIIFDAEREVLWLLTERPAAVPEGWAEAPWSIEPLVATHPGGTTYVATMLPTVEVCIGGEPRLAMLDTGADSGVIAQAWLPLSGADVSSVWVRDSFRHRARGRKGELAAPLEIAGITFDNVEAIVLEGAPNAVEDGFELTIGLEVLARQPVWFDAAGGRVLFWTGEGPPTIPELNSASP